MRPHSARGEQKVGNQVQKGNQTMSLTNVSFLLQKLKQSWLIENFPYKLQIPRAWAWKPIEGTQVSFARTNQMDAASLADVNTGACDT